MKSPDGLGDRMRTAAFAELQAIRAFTWAADHFSDVPDSLRDTWRAQVADEQKHYDLIRHRMAELGIGIKDKPVSAKLWDSLSQCESGKDFCIYICSAEERGRQAGIKLVKYLAEKDPATAAVFQEIVTDEVAHVALAKTYFDWSPSGGAV